MRNVLCISMRLITYLFFVVLFSCLDEDVNTVSNQIEGLTLSNYSTIEDKLYIRNIPNYGSVSNVNYSSNGKYLYFTNEDSFCTIDVTTGSGINSIDLLYTGASYALHPYKDSICVYSTLLRHNYGGVFVGDVEKKDSSWTFAEFPYLVNKVDFTPDGKRIAVLYKNVLYLWDYLNNENTNDLTYNYSTTIKGQDVTTIHNAISYVSDFQFQYSNFAMHTEKEIIAVANEENTIEVWDIAQNIILNTFSCGFSITEMNLFANDTLMVKGDGGTIKLYNLYSGVVIAEYLVIDSAVNTLNNQLVIIDANNSLISIDLNTLTSKYTIELESRALAIALNNDGDVINVFYDSGNVITYDADLGNQLHIMKINDRPITNDVQIQYSPDGKSLIINDKNGKTSMYNLISEDLQYTIEKRFNKTLQLEYIHDANALIVLFENGEIGCFDLDNMELTHRLNVDPSHKSRIQVIGNDFVVFVKDKNDNLGLYDSRGMLIYEKRLPYTYINDYYLSPDRKFLFYYESDSRIENNIKIVDIETNERIFIKLDNSYGGILSSYRKESPFVDSNIIIVSGDHYEVWNYLSGKLLGKLIEQSECVINKTLSAEEVDDQYQIAYLDDDHLLNIIDAVSGRLIIRYENTHEFIDIVDNSYNQQVISTDSSDRVFLYDSDNFCLIDLETDELLFNYEQKLNFNSLCFKKSYYSSAGSFSDFIYDDRFLVLSSSSGGIDIWDSVNGEHIGKLVLFGIGEWLLYTNEGFMSVSDELEDAVFIKTKDGILSWNELLNYYEVTQSTESIF